MTAQEDEEVEHEPERSADVEKHAVIITEQAVSVYLADVPPTRSRRRWVHTGYVDETQIVDADRASFCVEDGYHVMYADNLEVRNKTDD